MKLFRFLFHSLITLVVASNAFATFQKEDKFVYEGKTYGVSYLADSPLEPYFKEYPEKRVALEKTFLSNSVSTNLWRGYLATFEIRGDFLVLKDLEIRGPVQNTDGSDDDWVSVLDQVFPNKETLVIEWLHGLQIFPDGEEVYSKDFDSVYGYYLILDLDRGKVLSRHRIYGNRSEIYRAHDEGKLDQYANRRLNTCQVNDSDIASKYVGECKDGYAHGVGIAIGRDEYRGSFHMGDVHGRGLYIWGDDSLWASEQHAGFFNHGKKDGFGTTSVNVESNHSDIDWYLRNGQRVGNEFILRGLFQNHEFVSACDSPSACQEDIDRLKELKAD